MRNSFVKQLLENAKRDSSIILMTGDLGYGVLDEFKNTLPNQFINAGISEQNMLSVAAGLALSGKNVYVYSIGNFPTLRPLEQIRNDICYHNANVKIICVGGGFAYGALGMSHHATEDIAILRALPNMRVLTPCDTTEVIAAVDFTVKFQGPCYIRLGKGGEPKIHDKKCDFQAGKAICIEQHESADTVIFACGSIIAEAVEVNKALEAVNKNKADIYSFISVKPIDKNLIISSMSKYKRIITLEEHNIVGGFGSAVSEIIAQNKGAVNFKMIGLKDCYSSIVGSQNHLRKVYEMDKDAILKELLHGQ